MPHLPAVYRLARHLEQRVRRSIRPRWSGVLAVFASRVRLTAAAVVLITVGIAAAIVNANTIRDAMADALATMGRS
jgi:hypothetical protein